MCRGRARGLCDPRRGALRPPRPVLADARSLCGSVGQSVSHGARAAGAADALSVRVRSVAPGEAAATGAAAASRGAPGGPRGCHGECSTAWPSRSRERKDPGAPETLPPPFSPRLAWPVGRVRAAAVRGGVAARLSAFGLRPARRPAVGRGRRGLGCPLHPSGLHGANNETGGGWGERRGRCGGASAPR